jgi:hypothetical protein
MPLGLRESPPDTTIQFLHMWNKILVTLDNQNEVRHLNLLTFALGGESLGGSEGAGAEGVVRGPRQRCMCRGWAVGTEVYYADGHRQLPAKASQPW